MHTGGYSLPMILLISDIHGSRANLQRILDSGRYESIIFCGDGLNDLVFAAVSPQIQVTSVLGNCDRAGGYHGENSAIMKLGASNVLVVHGDLHDAKQTTSKLVSAALARGADIVFFGHTHLPCSVEEGGVHLVNPGAVRDGCYAICSVVHGTLKLDFKRIPPH